MLFPTIPDNWQELSATELRELASQIREAVAGLPEKVDAETRDLAIQAVAARKELLAEAAAKDAFASIEMSEDEEADPESDDDDADESDDDDDDAGEDLSADADDDEADEALAAKVPARKPRVSNDLGASGDDSAPIRKDTILSRGEFGGPKAGAAFDDWGDLTMALIEAASSISPSSNQKVKVGYVQGNFTEAQTLGENMIDNLRRFNSEEITAAFCAPTTPTYDLACWNTDRRPVRASLPQFRPDARGSVSIFPSPSLSDITDQDGGVGLWDSDDDDSQATTDPSVKECAVITCGSPTVYSLYGVWRCLTIQNLLAMTFPELVEAWLNRLGAAHARLADTQLLEAMGSSAEAVTGKDLGYGAAVNVTSQILELIALHQEKERWDGDSMEAWIPRWVRYAFKMDIMRRRNTSGAISVPTDAAIDQMFRNVGVEPRWFIDTPTWAATVPNVASGGGDLNSVPDTIDMILAPRGKFAVMDRGELNIGVTGNNIYRDNQSNAHNQFTMFWENFEGLVDTDSCPAYQFEIPNLCYNGQQIDDLVLACDGAVPNSA